MTSRWLLAVLVARSRARRHDLDPECDPFADSLPDRATRGMAEVRLDFDLTDVDVDPAPGAPAGAAAPEHLAGGDDATQPTPGPTRRR